MELISTLGVDVRGPDGSAIAVQASEVVVFYFSAHWCPPCRQFTPLLAKVHAFIPLQEDEPPPGKRYLWTSPPQSLHVIFVSGDKSEPEMKSYMAESHGKWSYVSFGSPGADALNRHFNVRGIPSIHVCSPSGSTVVPNAQEGVMMSAGNETAAKALVQSWRAAAAVRTDVWPCGMHVELHGLKQEELNGQTCQVEGVDLSTGRVKVRTAQGDLHSSKVVAVRRESCAQVAYGTVRGELVELRPGDHDGYKFGDEEVIADDVVPAVGTVVRIEGLKSKPEKNGTWGTVLSYDDAAGRLEVEMSPVEVLKLKPANLRI